MPPLQPIANQETINKAKTFMDNLTAVLDFVEEMVQYIPEGKYLEMMNITRDMYNQTGSLRRENPVAIQQVITTLMRNPIVAQQARIINYRPKKFELEKSDADKLKSGTHLKCKKCDKVISKSYMKHHTQNNSCIAVNQTKKLTFTTTHLNTNDYSKCITLIKAYMNSKIVKRINMYKYAIHHFTAEQDYAYVNLLRVRLNEFADEII